MGGCQPKNFDAKTKQLDQEIGQDKKKESKVRKVLFLGAGGSGKSTLFKQLGTLYGEKVMTEKDRLHFRNQIYSQCIEQMKEAVAAIEIMNEDEEFDVEDLKLSEEALEASETLHDNSKMSFTLNRTIADVIEILWNDPAIKLVFENRALLNIDDSCEFFWNKIQILAAENYLPSDEDLLMVRNKTTGINEQKFEIKGNTFLVVDVGGQKSERKKWYVCFDKVTAVIFVASMSAYDEIMYEEEKRNRMDDQVELFSSICNHEAFEDRAIILFLNKFDLFLQKLEKKPLGQCFDDYKGGDSPEDAVLYIQSLFEMQNRNPAKHVFVHVTTAIDKTNVDKVFADVQHVIVNVSLQGGGLL